ncbi:serine hydrolase domain-containing protein [Brevundimonas sp.]|uniref:serine hydrolase domain-containing protein n=1 Tax=Brevundimonas sp. TaxID=1871086 RepID=UPI002D3C015F|nr:serine hydrolase domain-containing protein [Brevundimonas sp.]HYC96867.1 serine hydrolase domain-containing protein [Brevundimonas sp.]
MKRSSRTAAQRTAGRSLAIAIWALGVAFFSFSADARASEPLPWKAAVDEAAALYLRDNPEAAAISIGVLKDGETHVLQYGTLIPGEDHPPREDTLFAIASITKTFTGTLLAQAAAEGRVSLSEDVRNYLDGDYPNLEFDGRPIRLMDLLDHRSGLPFLLPDRPELDPGFQGDPRPYATRVAEVASTYDRTQFFDDLARVELTAAPGATYQYSNAAAQLAGYVLERIYGQSYADLLRTRILEPLSMYDTALSLTAEQQARLAPGWDDAGRQMPENPEWLAAAGALKSTTPDMLKYLRWHVEDADPAVRLSHQPVFTSTQPVFGDRGVFSVGLNWQMIEIDGRRVIWQDGMVEGASALCILQPELKLGLVVMTNQLGPRTAQANKVLVNTILKSLNALAVPLP